MQHDFVLDNQSGLFFRQDLNNALQALISESSGATAPAAPVAFQNWIDTSGANPILRKRNAANSAWITIGRVDLEGYGLAGVVSGATAPPSPLAYQFWVDTAGANPILKQWIPGSPGSWNTIGQADLLNLGLLALAGGTLTGPLLSTNTDHWKIPVGTTAQRTGTPASGMFRFNSDLVQFEGHNGTAWAPIGGGGYTVSTVQSLTVAGTINSSTTDQRQMRLVQGNTAPITVSNTPFGAVGGWRDGTEILLIGQSSANSVTLTYNDIAKGLVGNFSSIELGNYESALCVYSSALDRWILQGGT